MQPCLTQIYINIVECWEKRNKSNFTVIDTLITVYADTSTISN